MPDQITETDELPRCAQGRPVADATYMVFFDHHSAQVAGRSKKVVDEFVARVARELPYYKEIGISLSAGKDTSETLPRDQTLDWRRGRAVERLLRENGGLPSNARTKIIPTGTAHMPVPTGLLTQEPQNRSVYLIFSDGKQVRPFSWQADCQRWLRSHKCGAEVSAAQTAICKQVEKVANEFRP